MILDEETAKTKRCCGPEGCGDRRGGDGVTLPRYCMGSACMAWTWQWAAGETDEAKMTKSTTHGSCGYSHG